MKVYTVYEMVSSLELLVFCYQLKLHCYQTSNAVLMKQPALKNRCDSEWHSSIKPLYLFFTNFKGPRQAPFPLRIPQCAFLHSCEEA